MNTRTLSTSVAAAALYAMSCIAGATPILDGGWDTSDGDGSLYTDHIVDVLPALNVGGAYGYALSGPAVFRITDALALGDIWTVYDFGVAILTTAVTSFASGFGDNADADGYWTDATHSKGEVLLGGGAHSLTVSGNGAGGLPAHYYARIDAIPEPMTLVLYGLALTGLVLGRRARGR